MYTRNGYDQYRNQSVLTAGPAELLIMLYDGCLRHLGQARTAMQETNSLTARQHLLKAQDIITELINGLDFEYDIAHQLYSLYEYMGHELTIANVDQDPACLDRIEPLLRDLRETWEQVSLSVQRMAIANVI